MDEVILTTEIVLGVVFLLIAAFLIITLVRRRLIAGGSSPSLCTVRIEGERWSGGLLKQTPRTLEWYPLFGLMPRPRHVWRRGSLDVEDAKQADAHPASRAIGIVAPIHATFVVDDPGSARTFEVMLPSGAYTALRAWLEAAPPMDDHYGL